MCVRTATGGLLYRIDYREVLLFSSTIVIINIVVFCEEVISIHNTNFGP